MLAGEEELSSPGAEDAPLAESKSPVPPTGDEATTPATENETAGEEGAATDGEAPAPVLDENGEPIADPPSPAEGDPSPLEGSSSANASRHASNVSLHRGDVSTDWYDQHEVEFQLEQKQKRESTLTELLDKTKAPLLYYTNSKKEENVLEYVANFERQYTQLFPGRRELILAPPNQFGVPKFVCTTVRATHLPYRDLYDYRGCARFVAEYLSYVTLQPAHELPSMLPGPDYTLQLQQGSAFDYSILLVSLLRGVGYDAYVVSGYATRAVTLMDESRVESSTAGIPPPTGTKPSTEADTPSVAVDRANGADQNKPPNKYKLKPPRTLKSQFLVKQDEKAKAKAAQDAAAERKRLLEARALADDDDDELKGLRVHAWVLVLPGKREVAEAFFIEATTGAVYTTEHESYLGVECVFSSVNFWVNMQVCYEGLKGISFDLGDNAKWEFVLLDNVQPGSDPNDDAEDQANDVGSDDGAGGGEILDLPPSWVERLSVDKEKFESKCPSGAKMIMYRDARHEVYAEYFRKDGMVSRTIFFADDTIGFNGEIREIFRNRRDKLRERIRIPYEGRIHEFFDPGRPSGMKEHIIIDDRTKEMHFYGSARFDGLVKRVDETIKVIEHFTDREDRLVYRSVTFDGEEDDESERGAIFKMAEKLDRHPDIPSHKDVAKRSYFLKDDKIRVIYHLEEGKIIPSSREFKKPTAEQKTHFIEATSEFEVNPYRKPPKKQDLYSELLELLQAEQNCLAAIKTSDREVNEILNNRQGEEKEVLLNISVHDTLRNQTKLPSEEKKETSKDEEESNKTDLDYLSPFLVSYSNPSHLAREECIAIKDACLKAFKERLIEKANIIQIRLDEVTADYQRRQLAYSRNADSMSAEETEAYVKYCNDALFKIHILEKRLAKHKETAPERYVELDSKLKADPRLSAAKVS
ncbi:uncharacterized protein EV422DRAFT_622654 [Fimicolochytrium jonesii]|uniref:uncharacterized protein n=1 Tax=Fimicolochytrium jonesii TaxID=1396493 RepID=UPI0022FE46B3|nr:uncharacterized protein EV422DRAFT_622654 [Fimicolochytrium jonesii]KAI8817432.1 hypothetical protein EV422DRAFT_622654 [Fimicolochytrium jonesii]